MILSFRNTAFVYEGITELVNGTTVITPIADSIVCTMSAICLEDFNEVIGAAGMGLGFAATKLTRCFYERVVTLKYLSMHPGEAEAWLDYSHVNWTKLTKEDCDLDAEFLKHIEDNFNRVKPRFTRGQKRKLQNNWTPKGVIDLANESSPLLRQLYMRGFVMPSIYVHPTSLGLSFETKHSDDGGISLNVETMREDLINSLSLSHLLLVQVFEIVNLYFKKGHELKVSEFNQRLSETWPMVFRAEPAPPS